METDTGGASRFWTHDADAIGAARKLVLDGQLSEAEKSLRPLAAAGDGVADEGLQVISWIRRDYSLDADQLLKKVRSGLPAATAVDIERWREAKEFQHRLIDGQARYFRSEPSNLIRFCGEAKAMKRPDGEAKWKLTDHIARVIKAADEQRRPDVVPMRHRMHFTLTVNADAPGMKKGSMLRVWLPFPQIYRQQSKVYLVSTEPANGQISPDGVPHRCVYFERKVEDPSAGQKFAVSFEYLTTAWCPKLDDAAAKITTNAELLREYLGERPPHLVFTPELKAAATEALVGEKSDNPLVRARHFFRWISKNIPWNSEEEYGIVPSTVRRGLARRRGDCGVQGMIFIAMCHFAGIPARWQSGWETKRLNNSMHDWSEIHLEPWGWLPVDASYGLQESDDPRVREFYFGHTDSYRLIINTDYGKALWPAKHSLRSEPLDFQRGEVELDGKNLYFDRWDWNIDIQWLDQAP
jgi:transglutaminase-like putative cysteine protease